MVDTLYSMIFKRRSFRKFLDDKELVYANKEDCKKFIDYVQTVYKKSTCEKIYSYLHSFFNYLKKEEYIEINPFRYVEKPVVTRMKNKDDVLFIDTAGRLQNKKELMDELQKIVRVIKKINPTAPHATLLSLDATVGQNAISQVEAFSQIIPLSGLIMTKLDGTAKGGILVALAEKFHLPVYYIGVGEKIDDLLTFNRSEYIKSLLGMEDV